MPNNFVHSNLPLQFIRRVVPRGLVTFRGLKRVAVSALLSPATSEGLRWTESR